MVVELNDESKEFEGDSARTARTMRLTIKRHKFLVSIFIFTFELLVEENKTKLRQCRSVDWRDGVW